MVNADKCLRSIACVQFSGPRTPRRPRPAKANFAARMLQRGDPTALSTDEVRAVADLCVNCKMWPECPSHVNVPKLMLEAKAANAAGTVWTAPTGSWPGSGFSALGSRSRLVNWTLAHAARISWVLEKIFGLAPPRRLPPFARRSFLRTAQRRGWTKPPAMGERNADCGPSWTSSPITSIRRSPRRPWGPAAQRFRRIRAPRAGELRHRGAGPWRRGAARDWRAATSGARRPGP